MLNSWPHAKAHENDQEGLGWATFIMEAVAYRTLTRRLTQMPVRQHPGTRVSATVPLAITTHKTVVTVDSRNSFALRR